MKFTCTTLRKTDSLTFDDKVSFGDVELAMGRLYYQGASLTREHAEYLIKLDVPHKKKDYLHFKSPSWLTGISDDIEDQYAVDNLNIETCRGINCSESLEVSARVHKTTTMNPLLFRKGEILSMEPCYYREASDIDVIFCERISSYQKTFDLTIVLKDKSIETHSCVDRKRLKDITAWSNANDIGLYQGSADPISMADWKVMFKSDLSWAQIAENMNHIPSDEDEGDVWVPGETDEEVDSDHDFDSDTESDYDYESSDDEPDTKKRKY